MHSPAALASAFAREYRIRRSSLTRRGPVAYYWPDPDEPDQWAPLPILPALRRWLVDRDLRHPGSAALSHDATALAPILGHLARQTKPLPRRSTVTAEASPRPVRARTTPRLDPLLLRLRGYLARTPDDLPILRWLTPLVDDPAGTHVELIAQHAEQHRHPWARVTLLARHLRLLVHDTPAGPVWASQPPQNPSIPCTPILLHSMGRHQAALWLRAHLAPGTSRPTRDVLLAALDAGHAPNTVREAARDINLTVTGPRRARHWARPLA